MQFVGNSNLKRRPISSFHTAFNANQCPYILQHSLNVQFESSYAFLRIKIGSILQDIHCKSMPLEYFTTFVNVNVKSASIKHFPKPIFLEAILKILYIFIVLENVKVWQYLHVPDYRIDVFEVL